jgi:hypothetical protein
MNRVSCKKHGLMSEISAFLTETKTLRTTSSSSYEECKTRMMT